jgi:hypothetical protein
MNPFIKHTNQFDHTLGLKQYECSNHLGNVLAVITDRKHPIDDNNDGTIDYYQPEIVKAVDYSPFGVELYERNFTRTEVTVIDVNEIITIIDEDDFGLSTNAGAYNVGDQGVNWDHTLGTGEVTGQENYLVSTFKPLFKDRNLNPRTIRQSVITHLLDQGKDIRLLQVFSGYKYPSATEKYKQSDNKEFKYQILKFHPLG